MKASLQLNLSNQLTVTPQLQQAIRLLQLSSLDLQHEIQQQLDSNPLLESVANEDFETKGEDVSETGDEFEDFQWSNLYVEKPSNNAFNENEFILETLHCTKESLKDHLLWQLELTPMSDIDRVIATTIVDAIDEDGFLTQSLKEIQKNLSSRAHRISLGEVKTVLHRIQRLDPVGCGASTLVETLLIQLGHNRENTPEYEITHRIISDNLNLVAQHKYSQVKALYHIDDKILNIILDNIHHLHPKPGNLVSSEHPEFVIPDLLLKKSGEHWRVILNPEVQPHVSINMNYAALINKTNDTADKQYLKSNLKEARWFIKGLQSRQDTLLKVAQYIVNYQQAFFKLGEEAMKPLTLNDVAHALNMHESTVSRVTTQKYIYTPHGTFELKFFFSTHISSSKGTAHSSTAIKALVKKIIAAEDPKKPMSDNRIVLLMKKDGIQIARRTVAKYREELGIPPSFERKQF